MKLNSKQANSLPKKKKNSNNNNSPTQAPSAATDAQITPGMGKRAHNFGGC